MGFSIMLLEQLAKTSYAEMRPNTSLLLTFIVSQTQYNTECSTAKAFVYLC